VSACVLAVNTGSSSLKLRLLGPDDELLAASDEDLSPGATAALSAFLRRCPRQPELVGHRVVHGGAEFVEPFVVTAEIEARLAEAFELAPLHNLRAVVAITAARHLLPAIPQVACFDTAFHSTLPAQAFTYALPPSWRQLGPLRRFGFHGLSHAYASKHAAELLKRDPAELRLVTAHLGAGASLCAVHGGRSVDTTMGFTPLEGLVMSTRAGSIDPGLLLWVQRHGHLDADEAEAALLHDAGLAGISGTSGDMREVIAGIEAGDDLCQLAFDVYCHRLAAGVGAMAAAMGGVDALVLTGGVGENCVEVRDEIERRVGFLVSSILVVEAREDLEIARLAREVA
jgi:acetate kinase